MKEITSWSALLPWDGCWLSWLPRVMVEGELPESDEAAPPGVGVPALEGGK